MPTSFSGCSYLVLQLNYMMFLTNRGTPQYCSPFNQIKSVAHILVVTPNKISVVVTAWLASAVSPNPVHADSGQVVMQKRTTKQPPHKIRKHTISHISKYQYIITRYCKVHYKIKSYKYFTELYKYIHESSKSCQVLVH